MMERFGNQQPSRLTPEQAWDELQLRLGVMGMIPGFGEPCDAVDGIISVFRGDYAGAALSGGSMIPFVGWGAGITKIARRSDDVLPSGGVYRLIDPDTGLTMRTGQTNDLARRRNEHRRDPNLGGFRFEPVYRTDDYATRRGLEQLLFNNSPAAPFNFRNPIGSRNPNREAYTDAANSFCGCQ